MQFDVRIPIGAMFSLIGALLLIYGWSASAPGGPGSAGLNVNAWWGGIMALFGLCMLGLAHRGRARRGSSEQRP
jgi:hypothetical protein